MPDVGTGSFDREFWDSNKLYVARAALRREIRDRARLIHRHRRLLEIADYTAERADTSDRSRWLAGRK